MIVKADATTLVESLAFSRSDVSGLLDQSAGTTTAGVTTYRPYAVAAFLWITSKNTTRLLEARGAKFENPREMIAGLLGMQRPWDEDLTIPDGWSVNELLASAGGGDSEIVF